VLDELWPDYEEQHFDAALEWYGMQDRTLGGQSARVKDSESN
jgi:undecaprenyl pyrophosphate synthase